AVVVGDVRLAGGMAPEELDPVRVLPGHREQRTGADAAFAPGVPDDELLGEAVEHLLEHGPVQLLLPLEVPVHDEFRDAGGGRDVLHRRRRVPGPGEGPSGTAEDRLLAGGAGEGAAVSGGAVGGEPAYRWHRRR